MVLKEPHDTGVMSFMVVEHGKNRDGEMEYNCQFKRSHTTTDLFEATHFDPTPSIFELLARLHASGHPDARLVRIDATFTVSEVVSAVSAEGPPV